jgi:hypothetical protein
LLQDSTHFYGDGDNGVSIIAYSGAPSAAIHFATQGAERMQIDATGNVGIHINNPTDLLHIQTDAAKPDAVMIQTASDSSHALIRFRDTSPGQARYCGIQFLNNAGAPQGALQYGSINSSVQDSLLVLTAGVERTRINVNGINLPRNDGIMASRVFGKQDAETGLGFETGGVAPIVFYTNPGALGNSTPSYERLRIAGNGDVTVTTGALRCNYGFSTSGNTTSAPHNTLVNAGLAFTTGAWLVHAYIYGIGTGNYSACAIVLCDGSDARIALGNNGTLLQISVTGMGLYGIQTSGVTQTIIWTLTKFYG